MKKIDLEAQPIGGASFLHQVYWIVSMKDRVLKSILSSKLEKVGTCRRHGDYTLYCTCRL